MARILIADDDDIVAALASEVLIDAGHACGWVANGEDAWELINARRPDLLLLDQDMPGMSGATMLRRMRTSSKLYDLPVIMFTAMSGDRDEEQAIYAGAQDYIRKPFTPKSLKYRVERQLALRRSRPQHTDLRTWLERSSGSWAESKQVERRIV